MVAGCSSCSQYETLESEDPINSDPLGIFGGALADEIAAAQSSNDNASSSLINNGRLALNSHQSGTLSSGTYYLTSLELKSGSLLNIDSSGGPVRLFVSSFLRIWPNSNINNDASPVNLQIYSTTNRDVKILPNSDFNGMIYAPHADVLAMPNGDYNGTIWSNNAYVKPGGNVNVDVALLDQVLLNKLEINHWKEVRSE
jgi:hypothetical protein